MSWFADTHVKHMALVNHQSERRSFHASSAVSVFDEVFGFVWHIKTLPSKSSCSCRLVRNDAKDSILLRYPALAFRNGQCPS